MKKFIPLIFCVIFTGCTADREFQKRIIYDMAKNRADIINMDLPISYEELTINKSLAKNGIIYISATEKNKGKLDYNKIINRVCQNKETKKILEFGVKYQLNTENHLLIIDNDKCDSL